MAAIGQTLINPEDGWSRYDNLNTRISYTGSDYLWTWDNPNAWAGWYNRVEVSQASSFSFNFIGTKLRFIGIKASNACASVSIKIDDVERGPFSQRGNLIWQCLQFEILNLSNEEHKVVISPGINSGTNFYFDAIDIDNGGVLLAYNPSPPTISGAAICSSYALGIAITTQMAQASVACSSSISGAGVVTGSVPVEGCTTATAVAVATGDLDTAPYATKVYATGESLCEAVATGEGTSPVVTLSDFSLGYIMGIQTGSSRPNISFPPYISNTSSPTADFKNGFLIGVVAATRAPAEVPSSRFEIILNTYNDNAPKVIMGVLGGTEEIYSNTNGRISGSIIIWGAWPNISYTLNLNGWTLTANNVKISVVEGKLFLEVSSLPRINENDHVALTLNVENNTIFPLVIHPINDDASDPRFILGDVSGEAGAILGVWHPTDAYGNGYWSPG